MTSEIEKKQKKKLYDQKRYQINKTKLQAQFKEYYQNNKETIKATTKKWAENNPDKRAAIMDRWLNNNPERRKEIVNNHYQKNSESINAKLRDYQSSRTGIGKYLLAHAKANFRRKKLKYDLDEPWIEELLCGGV